MRENISAGLFSGWRICATQRATIKLIKALTWPVCHAVPCRAMPQSGTGLHHPKGRHFLICSEPSYRLREAGHVLSAVMSVLKVSNLTSFAYIAWPVPIDIWTCILGLFLLLLLFHKLQISQDFSRQQRIWGKISQLGIDKMMPFLLLQIL